MAESFVIVDGVRRAKALQLAGATEIEAEVLGPGGRIVERRAVPVESLRSPKIAIRRQSTADEIRWNRAVQGARRDPIPFPPIVVRRGSRGTMIEDVGFDQGED